LVGLLADVGYLLKDISSGSVLPLDGAALRKLIPHGGGRNALAYCPRHAESKTFHAA
jgi:hypothetical protein